MIIKRITLTNNNVYQSTKLVFVVPLKNVANNVFLKRYRSLNRLLPKGNRKRGDLLV